MKGKCWTENIIYKCIMATPVHPDQAYLGIIEGVF